MTGTLIHTRARAQKVFGFAGFSGSGKTTLLVNLIPEFTNRGLSVSTIKHAHHGFDIDKPGKDSFEHRAAGAHEVLVSSRTRWALMHEQRAAPEASLDELIGRMSPVDLVLIEGFRNYGHDKMEIVRGRDAHFVLATEDPHVVAIASDKAIPETQLPVFDLNDASAIANFVVHHCGLAVANDAAALREA
jgi:molybdopterin-guanine dinucleotide biosynthesis protein B